jgi:hypothetical protein
VAAPGILSFTLPVYAGVSGEAGNVWQSRGDFGDDPVLGATF